MTSTYPEHPLTYRQEILTPLFNRLQSGESLLIIGAASVAKSNLIRFILRKDVQDHYLASTDQKTLLVLVDINREAGTADWAFYELVLHSLALEIQGHPDASRLQQTLHDLHRDVVLHENRLLAQRSLERAIDLICRESGYRLVLMIDEADPFYQSAHPSVLFNLRAWRDQYKYRLCYVLFTRTPLERLRKPGECESFDELFSRNVLGLKPYTPVDAERVIRQLEARKGPALTEAQRKLLAVLSGGHPGLLVACFDSLASRSAAALELGPDKMLEETGIIDECWKLWNGLQDDERYEIQQATTGLDETAASPGARLLLLKGLLAPSASGPRQVFSPIFAHFIEKSIDPLEDFRVDETTATVWVGGRQILGLTPLEFRLAKLLADHRGEVLNRDQILEGLYPEDQNPYQAAQDNRVDTLIRRLRLKIEPAPGKPRYLLTVHGHGYKLAGETEKEKK